MFKLFEDEDEKKNLKKIPPKGEKTYTMKEIKALFKVFKEATSK
jgi:hypothetical protein